MENKELLKQIDFYKKKHRQRRTFAYALLGVSISIVIIGIILINSHFGKIMEYAYSEAVQAILRKLTKEDRNWIYIINLVSGISFVILLLIIFQILIKLYRYHVLISDDYLATAKSLELISILRKYDIEALQRIKKSLTSENITFSEYKFNESEIVAKLFPGVK